MNSYDLSRRWFNWSFDNPEKIRPIHGIIYFFAIEQCNRLGWKEKFGFPSQMVMEAIGVKNWRTYSKALNDLVEFGFIEMIETSKNQYSSNIIAIVKNTKANTKALDKALSKHSTKHSQSTVSINKQYNKEQLTNNNIPTLEEFLEYAHEKIDEFNLEITDIDLKMKYESWRENNWKTGGNKPRKILNWKTTLINTLKYLNKKEKSSAKKEKLTAAQALRQKYGISNI